MHYLDADKTLEKKLDGKYTRMLRAILNRSWQQHPARRQLYGHLPPITKTIQARRTRHAGYCWRSKDEIVSDVLLWTLAYGQSKTGRPARTYSSYVMIRDVTPKTCRRRWMIGRRGERGSGISVLAARHDDDDDCWIKLRCYWHRTNLKQNAVDRNRISSREIGYLGKKERNKGISKHYFQSLFYCLFFIVVFVVVFVIAFICRDSRICSRCLLISCAKLKHLSRNLKVSK